MSEYYADQSNTGTEHSLQHELIPLQKMVALQIELPGRFGALDGQIYVTVVGDWDEIPFRMMNHSSRRENDHHGLS